LIALIAGMGLFVLLPTTLPEQAGDMLALAWPIWVAQAAPMTAALTLAVLSAPALALDLSGRHASGELAALPAGYAQPAGYPCMPWIVALSAACTAAAVLLVLFSLLFGLLASLVMNVGDVSADARLVLAAASPLKWLRLVASSALLGLVCGLSAVLYAWPGTQDAQTPASAHRLTLRVMLVSSLACVGTGLAINWVAALFGWNN
jgi:hypothetical protein